MAKTVVMVGALDPKGKGFAFTQGLVDQARAVLEARGCEVRAWYAAGTGGQTVENVIAEEHAVALMDITTELADEVCGGVSNARPERCLAAWRAGIPAVLVPGGVDMANFGALETVPEKYNNRLLYQWNPSVTLLRTNVADNVKMGEMLAAAANAATAPVAVAIPLGGVSMLDREDGQFWDPLADHACFDVLKQHLRPGIRYIAMDDHINDRAFAEKVAETLLALLKQ